jgi:Transcription factor WhiB
MTPNWDLALCAQVPPSMRRYWTSSHAGERLAARLACRECPIVEACVSWAITHLSQADTAIYGAMTYKARCERRAAWLAASGDTRWRARAS